LWKNRTFAPEVALNRIGSPLGATGTAIPALCGSRVDRVKAYTWFRCFTAAFQMAAIHSVL